MKIGKIPLRCTCAQKWFLHMNQCAAHNLQHNHVLSLIVADFYRSFWLFHNYFTLFRIRIAQLQKWSSSYKNYNKLIIGIQTVKCSNGYPPYSSGQLLVRGGSSGVKVCTNTLLLQGPFQAGACSLGHHVMLLLLVVVVVFTALWCKF